MKFAQKLISYLFVAILSSVVTMSLFGGVPEEEYAAAFEVLAQQMRREIDAITAKGGEEE